MKIDPVSVKTVVFCNGNTTYYPGMTPVEESEKSMSLSRNISLMGSL